MAPPAEHGATVAFRVDSGVTLGGGHLMRCLALASELRRRNAQVVFVSRAQEGHLSQRVEQDGFEVLLLPSREPSAGDAADARETLDTLGRRPVQWMVVDHYALGLDWETAVRMSNRKLLVIDDLASRAHNADALLDQNFAGPATASRYDGLVPANCVTLLGPRFALLAAEYAELSATARAKAQPPRRVLIAFGGSDSTNETGKVLEALSSPEFAGLAADVVLGANHPAPQQVLDQAMRRPGTTVHRSLASLANVMSQADVAIGAGGITTWERLCLNVPSAVVTIAPNQVPSTRALSEAGYVLWIGSAPAQRDYAAAFRELPPDLSGLLPLVDGLGARRAAEFLVPSSTADGTLRRARQNDAALFFDWRNDAGVREQSFSQDPLSWPSHRRWFEAKLGSSSAEVFVGEIQGLPIGQVRLDFTNDECVLSYSVDAVVRGRGWGGWLVAQAMTRASTRRCRVLRAEVREANTASRRIFSRLGWREIAADAGRREFNWTPAAAAMGESQ